MDGTILGKKYDLMGQGGGGGGTTVVANPSGSATADLTKLQVGEGIYGIPSTAAKMSYDNTTSHLTADDVQEAIDEMVANFGDGVDRVYNACVSAGSTPASKSPADIATAIGNISGGSDIPVYLENGLLTSEEVHHNTVNLTGTLSVGDVLIVSYKDGNDIFSKMHTFTGNEDEVNFGGYSIVLTSTTARGYNLSGNWRDIYGKVAGVDSSQIYVVNRRKRGKK